MLKIETMFLSYSVFQISKLVDFNFKAEMGIETNKQTDNKLYNKSKEIKYLSCFGPKLTSLCTKKDKYSKLEATNEIEIITHYLLCSDLIPEEGEEMSVPVPVPEEGRWLPLRRP